MGRDVAFAAGTRIATQPVGRGSQRPEQACRSLLDAGQDVAVLSQHAHGGGQVRRVPVAANVRLRRSQSSAQRNIAVETTVDGPEWSPRHRTRIRRARTRTPLPPSTTVNWPDWSFANRRKTARRNNHVAARPAGWTRLASRGRWFSRAGVGVRRWRQSGCVERLFRDAYRRDISSTRVSGLGR